MSIENLDIKLQKDDLEIRVSIVTCNAAQLCVKERNASTCANLFRLQVRDDRNDNARQR